MSTNARVLILGMAGAREKKSSVDVHGHRKFYDFEFVDENLKNLLRATDEDVSEDANNLIQYIRSNVIGADFIFQSPFGLRKGKETLGNA